MDDVLCLGSATVDHFLTVQSSFSSIKAGDKVLASSLEKHSGGGATNSAVALAKMGLKVSVLSKLGKDHDAEFIQKELRSYKIRNFCQNYGRKHTNSSTIIFSTTDKDRIIYLHEGAAAELSERDFPSRNLKTRWLYLGSLMGKGLKTLQVLAVLSRKEGIKVLFNPSLYLAQLGTRALRPLLRATNVLILNQEEAQALLEEKKVKVTFLLPRLHRLGPEIVIITEGAKPLYAYNQQKIYSLTPPPVKIVDTTGAGDAFNAGFLAGMIKDYSFEDCLRLGQANATSVIQAVGAKTKLLTEEKARLLLKKFTLKVQVHQDEF